MPGNPDRFLVFSQPDTAGTGSDEEVLDALRLMSMFKSDHIFPEAPEHQILPLEFGRGDLTAMQPLLVPLTGEGLDRRSVFEKV